MDRPDQPVRRLDLVEVAAERPQHQVGEHDRESDRDHGLAQILALHAAEDEDLQDDADQRHGDECDDETEDPGTGPGADGVTDIAAEQIERAMRQIDVAHQAEDQREAARHQEIKAAERDAVEDGVEENPLPADRLLEARRPDRKDQPQQHRDRDDQDQRPCRMAFDELAHEIIRPRWRCLAGRPPMPQCPPHALPSTCILPAAAIVFRIAFSGILAVAKGPDLIESIFIASGNCAQGCNTLAARR